MAHQVHLVNQVNQVSKHGFHTTGKELLLQYNKLFCLILRVHQDAESGGQGILVTSLLHKQHNKLQMLNSHSNMLSIIVLLWQVVLVDKVALVEEKVQVVEQVLVDKEEVKD
tara:strand:+ start:93 stop:428 length:336 start_codon:yes stop_codon:yes gene_type:complete